VLVKVDSNHVYQLKAIRQALMTKKYPGRDIQMQILGLEAPTPDFMQ